MDALKRILWVYAPTRINAVNILREMIHAHALVTQDS